MDNIIERVKKIVAEQLGVNEADVKDDSSFVEDLGGERKLINRAYLVMVALDENEKPVAVPHIIPVTDEEKEEFEAGIKRRALRKQRRQERF